MTSQPGGENIKSFSIVYIKANWKGGGGWKSIHGKDGITNRGGWNRCSDGEGGRQEVGGASASHPLSLPLLLWNTKLNK